MAKRKKKNRLPADVAPSLPPVAPGLLSPTRRVPAEIVRPPYALDGDIPLSARTISAAHAPMTVPSVARRIHSRETSLVGVTFQRKCFLFGLQ